MKQHFPHDDFDPALIDPSSNCTKGKSNQKKLPDNYLLL